MRQLWSPWGFELKNFLMVNKVRLSISISEVSTPIGAYAYFHALKSHPEHTDALNCRPTEYYRGL